MAHPIRVVLATVIAVFLARPATSRAAEQEKNRKLPATVARAVQENRPGAEIDRLTVERENGIVFYDFEFKASQGEMDVAEDGTVLDIATIIEMKDVPEVVAAAIRTAGNGKPIKQLSRSEVRAEIVKEAGKARISKLATPRYVYEAEFSRGEVEITEEGKIIKAVR